ncbi:MAG: hypothetical protein MR004_06285 [Clostridiales bacterium]|nr:hypothetical protein [Clostridiales bacterium]MDY4037666.1 hypothetical protein [Candidatus Pseudoscilispira sp.]
MINWKQKLSSRKFWAAVVAFVSALLFAFNVADSDVTQITSIIMAGGALIAYIFSEGWVDANRESGDTYISNFNAEDDTDGDGE